MNNRTRWITAGVTAMFAFIGAGLGVVAYYQHWLG